MVTTGVPLWYKGLGPSIMSKPVLVGLSKILYQILLQNSILLSSSWSKPISRVPVPISKRSLLALESLEQRLHYDPKSGLGRLKDSRPRSCSIKRNWLNFIFRGGNVHNIIINYMKLKDPVVYLRSPVWDFEGGSYAWNWGKLNSLFFIKLRRNLPEK